MFKTCALVASLLAVLMLPWGLQAAPIFKCTSNGAVTYQSDPCPPDVPVKKPTVEQLNAQRQKKPVDADSKPSDAEAIRSVAQPAAASGGVSVVPSAVNKGRVNATGAYRCDGRIHCSQMTSCDEAQYFLRHCPGARMDGDGNGIPCEKQWCSR